MERITADVDQQWETLSTKHQRLQKHFESILMDFARGENLHPSYLITGVFGQGKTAFLYYLFRLSFKFQLLPIFLTARDLFESVEFADYGELKQEVDLQVSRLADAIRQQQWAVYHKIAASLPAEIRTKIVEMYQRYETKLDLAAKVVLLVDELEDQYHRIKERAGTDPLRVWLEGQSYLKILALTPAGVYDLGGADSSRMERWNIPPVDIRYLREQEGLSAARSNALWWLSRGVPRHIVLNLPHIKEFDDTVEVFEIRQFLDSLEPIGKAPSRVPATIVSALSDHTKVRHILKLAPTALDREQRTLVIAPQLDDGELAEAFQEVFQLESSEIVRDVVLHLAYYFKMVTRVLSDEEWMTYIPKNESDEFLRLVLDVFLENEYSDDRKKGYLSICNKILQKLETDSTDWIFDLANRCDGLTVKKINRGLKLSIPEIRKIFPFPIADPTIVSNPEEVFKVVRDKVQPLWIGEEFMFFVTAESFFRYIRTDGFSSLVFPEGKRWVVMLEEDEYKKFERRSKEEPLIQWLQDTGKVAVAPLPSLLVRFLLSLSTAPYQTCHLERIVKEIEQSGEILKIHKMRLYYEAIVQIKKDYLPQPVYFFTGNLPEGAETEWGKGYLKEHVVLPAIALAFSDLSVEDEKKLAQLRDIVATLKGEVGLAIRKGLTTIRDRFLPRWDRRRQVVEYGENLRRFQRFWSDEEFSRLNHLAEIVGEQEFVKLHTGENEQRILRAFWRAVREKFLLAEVEKNELLEKVNAFRQAVQRMKEDLEQIRKDFTIDVVFPDHQWEKLLSAERALSQLTTMSFRSKLAEYLWGMFLKEITEQLLQFKVERWQEGTRIALQELRQLETQLQKLEQIGKDKLLDIFLSENLKKEASIAIVSRWIRAILKGSLVEVEAFLQQSIGEANPIREAQKAVGALTEILQGLRRELQEFKKKVRGYKIWEVNNENS